MYLKLALKNVKKSYQDFLVYFMTLSFSVCLFYTFNSFQEQKAVISIHDSQYDLITQLSGTMMFISIFVAIILGFLILYANNFLMKRRRKEFGIYMLLGMPRRNISHILIYETMLIGIISFLTGILLGLFLSQILTAITANLFEATLNYHFVFSPLAFIVTLCSFSFIFIIVILCQTFVIRKNDIIHFIKTDPIEKGKVKKLWLSTLLFILSLLFLATTYTFALRDPIKAFDRLDLIIVLGSSGTILFFLSLSGFLLSLIRSTKHLYFKNLNCFVLRQLSSTVNTSFISMSILCIMLLLSIGALSTGLNLKKTINQTLKASTPYDFSFLAIYQTEHSNQPIDMKSYIDPSLIDPSIVKEAYTFDIYDGLIKLDSFDTKTLSQDEISLLRSWMPDQTMKANIIPLSAYNQVMKDTNRKALSLKSQEGFLYYDSEYYRKYFEAFLSTSPTVQLEQQSFRIINQEYDTYYMYTTALTDTNTIYLVLPDQQIPKQLAKKECVYNINLKDTIDSIQYYEEFTQFIYEEHTVEMNASKYSDIYFYWYDADSIRVNSAGLSVSFTYVGIYLGIVFLIASAAILSLQLLSQAEDNKQRYAILTKIGTEESMQNKAILLQIGLYFLLPLILATIHSIVGIQMVNALVSFLGKGDILDASLLTATFFLLLYGAYFSLTYSQYKRILRHR